MFVQVELKMVASSSAFKLKPSTIEKKKRMLELEVERFKTWEQCGRARVLTGKEAKNSGKFVR